MFLREELVDVQEILGFNMIGNLVVSGKDLDITVINQTGMSLNHMLLDHRCTRHGMVENMQVLVDRLRSDLFSQTLLQGIMGHIHPDDDGTPDIVPHLLHRRVIHKVEIVTLDKSPGS